MSIAGQHKGDKYKKTNVGKCIMCWDKWDRWIKCVVAEGPHLAGVHRCWFVNHPAGTSWHHFASLPGSEPASDSL